MHPSIYMAIHTSIYIYIFIFYVCVCILLVWTLKPHLCYKRRSWPGGCVQSGERRGPGDPIPCLPQQQQDEGICVGIPFDWVARGG